MMLSFEQLLGLQKQIIEQSGGAHGLRDQAGLESALAQPTMSIEC